MFHKLLATKKPYCPTDKQAKLTKPNGSYLKSFCWLKDNGNHSQAYDHCSYYGMKLMVIDSPSLQTQISDGLLKWWPQSGTNNPWIDGVKDVNGNWYFYSYKKTLVPAGLSWWNSAAGDTGCLRAFNPDSSYKLRGADCASVTNILCEFQ